MLKRVTWFLTGAVAGVAGAGVAKRKVKAAAAQLTPANVVKSAAGKVREKGHDVADALRDGRAAMKDKEAELRANLDPPSAGPITVNEQVLVDGVPVEAGQVIIIREAGEEPTGPRRHSRRRSRR